LSCRLGDDFSPQALEIVKREKSYSQELQRAGKWAHIWRIVGEDANFSIFDVESIDELHTLLSGLPLFSCMDIHLTPRATRTRRTSRSKTRPPATTAERAKWRRHAAAWL
jgi:muconolactone D-isomerase